MKNNVAYTLIDTAGQTTAVIDVPIPRSQQPKVANPLMNSIKNIGQVCFIEKENDLFRLQMMGNELSVNGSLAGAYYLSIKIKKQTFDVKISGLQQTATYENSSVKFPNLIIRKTSDIVELDGIIYKLVTGFVVPKITFEQETTLQVLATNYPASGIVYFKKGKIQPLIFVKATNTFVWETCCGSASIAYASVTERNEIFQPSGEKVLIKIDEKDVIYSARCTLLE